MNENEFAIKFLELLISAREIEIKEYKKAIEELKKDE